MRFRGIDFGPVFDASGIEGFFGEGYFHHRFLRPFGLNFDGCTFGAKTTTLEKRDGNMPMKKDGITPKEFMPKCILPNFLRVKYFNLSVRMFLQGIMLNAVGLSGPGAEALFEAGRWQKRRNRFYLSFMSVAKTRQERTLELEKFVDMLFWYLPGFSTDIFLQINYTCPNVGLELECLVDEISDGLEIASVLGIALMPKFNVLTPVKTAKKISENPNCDGLCVSNTIPCIGKSHNSKITKAVV